MGVIRTTPGAIRILPTGVIWIPPGYDADKPKCDSDSVKFEVQIFCLHLVRMSEHQLDRQITCSYTAAAQLRRVDDDSSSNSQSSEINPKP